MWQSVVGNRQYFKINNELPCWVRLFSVGIELLYFISLLILTIFRKAIEANEKSEDKI